MRNKQSPEDDITQRKFWDDQYSSSKQMWSGNANITLRRYVHELEPTNALELGCGEGGDAIWLAKIGWQVTATDISKIAINRAIKAANNSPVYNKISFAQHDLSQSFPNGTFGLVSVHYLHSPIEFDKTAVLKKALLAVGIDGHLLIVDHAGPPPWSQHHHSPFPSVKETYDSLKLDQYKWKTIKLEKCKREAMSQNGHRVMLEDNVIFLRRLK